MIFGRWSPIISSKSITSHVKDGWFRTWGAIKSQSPTNSVPTACLAYSNVGNLINGSKMDESDDNDKMRPGWMMASTSCKTANMEHYRYQHPLLRDALFKKKRSRSIVTNLGMTKKMMMMSPTMMMITKAEKLTNPERRGESSRKTEIFVVLWLINRSLNWKQCEWGFLIAGLWFSSVGSLLFWCRFIWLKEKENWNRLFTTFGSGYCALPTP